MGGGIGGLAAAVALRARGANVVVYERSRREKQGVALLVWGNAVKALATLGVADDLLRVATPIEVTRVRDPRGELLAELPIGEWSKCAEMPTVTARRSDVLRVLAAKLAPDVVQEGCDLVAMEQLRGHVGLRFSDGSHDEVDALVGADGVSSIVRAQLLDDGPPRAVNQQAWVGWVAMRGEPGTATATVGRGPRFWSAPLADGVFWYATMNGTGERRDLLATMKGWHEPIATLIEGTREEDVVATWVRDRPPASRWGNGHVTLLGDAAHPCTPDLGQGACQAIESAVVLATSLARASSIEAGLRVYERLRMERTAVVTRLCWLTSVNSTIESPALCSVRDAAIRLGLRSVARGHLEWILRGQPC
ncbi:MAG: FAD-dependent monooxygenase [Kofleriaceae bacterium]